MTHTTEADLVVSQEDQDFRDALEKYAFEDQFGVGFLTDDALPMIAARRQRAMTQAADAAYLRGVEDAAKVAEGAYLHSENLGVDFEPHPLVERGERQARLLIAAAIRNLTSGERDG